MSLQKYFKEFNKSIKMDYEVKSELASKRDILLKKLRDSNDLPSFTELNQGSYIMYTGVEPLDKEYDIDVGLRFNVNKDDYENPTELKNKIYDILQNHTEYGAKVKKPCVTVTYKKNGETAYHVDLVVYTYEDKNDTESQLYLARGKDSIPEEICWEKSDPKGLVDYINNKYEADTKDREQYRRVIRYMKRWKNLKFSSSGNAEPPSIGITLIAADQFEVSKSYNYLEEKWEYDDLDALIGFTKEIQNLFKFQGISENGRVLYRIKYPLPSSLNFESDTDIFKKMTDIYMTDFKDKIDKLVNDLEAVKEEADEVEQCRMLNKIFGDDFKIPEKKNASKKQVNCIPVTSSSGV
ncbi:MULTISPECIES: nucleotidyltransferase domain-containing protein [Hungatella]|uniref:nucleotidyltransferase domain-containing protein n=1 Tax=Hungatella TaxID=1649459 RepID=UPI0011DCDCDE|nr:nucleotidyltransferase [Hungatella hathewayi]